MLRCFRITTKSKVNISLEVSQTSMIKAKYNKRKESIH